MYIDPLQEHWLDDLKARAATLPDHINLYLLLDGVFIPGMYRKRPFTSIGAAPVYLLFGSLPGCTDEVKDASPFLVQLTRTDGALAGKLSAALSQCSGLPMMSAIATTESLEELGQRLAAWCVIEHDGQRFNFRFPDTRRLPGLYDALRPDQRALFCGPTYFWSYIGRDGAWADLDVSGEASSVASEPVLDAEQFGRMVDDGAADEMLFRMTYGGLETEMPHSVLYATLCSALGTARAASLSDDLHREWCEYIVRHGGQHDNAAGLAQWQASMSEA